MTRSGPSISWPVTRPTTVGLGSRRDGSNEWHFGQGYAGLQTCAARTLEVARSRSLTLVILRDHSRFYWRHPFFTDYPDILSL